MEIKVLKFKQPKKVKSGAGSARTEEELKLTLL